MNKIQTKTSLFLAIYWGTNVIKVALDFIHNSSNVLIQLQLANVIFFTIRLIACSPCIHYFLETQTISILERYVLRAFRKENNVINCNHNFFLTIGLQVLVSFESKNKMVEKVAIIVLFLMSSKRHQLLFITQ